MNLPLKLVDLVTLLFLSLLVVIIVFIILQRNIKRFKLRNLKDSHYLSCKSIPRHLKLAIEKKHIMSNSYKEPPNLLFQSDLNQPEDKAKIYLTRMKAFEVSKNLEKALIECGYNRSPTTKFEEFIDDLINKEDKTLPKNLLNDFVCLYIWALFDPKLFTKEQLRRLNQIINKIIEQLAYSKKDIHDQIIKHKLELDWNGDFDFNKMFTMNNDTKTRSHSTNGYTRHTNNVNNNNNMNEFSNTSRTKYQKENDFDIYQMEYSTINGEKPCTSIDAETIAVNNLENEVNNSFKSKTKSKIAKLASNKSSKKLFQKASMSELTGLTAGSKETSAQKLKEKLKSGAKYEEIRDDSPTIPIKQSSKKNKSNANHHNHQNDSEIIEPDKRAEWSMTNDSYRNFDSENEEIPLVKKQSNHHKKKSSHSTITIIPSIVKNPSAVAPSNNILLNSVVLNENPGTLNIQTNDDTSKVGTSQDRGEENGGFNKTFETIF